MNEGSAWPSQSHTCRMFLPLSNSIDAHVWRKVWKLIHGTPASTLTASSTRLTLRSFRRGSGRTKLPWDPRGGGYVNSQPNRSKSLSQAGHHHAAARPAHLSLDRGHHS